MKNSEAILIGIDGGATKVSGWIVKHEPKTGYFGLTEHHAEYAYAQFDGFQTEFLPVPVQTQLAEREAGRINLSETEKQQASAYIDSVVETIKSLSTLAGTKPALIGIGMPGLKTSDLRGINALNNGPRIPDYCTQIEEKLKKAGIRLVAPIAHLGSDADYCGIGEFYANEGAFRDIKNAYYLGGGTGAADALLIGGQLMPFDHIKSWMAKTWEMKNEKNLSLERYASASGIQFVYGRHAGIPTEKLNTDQIYPPQIASLALSGDQAAVAALNEISEYLAWLFFERISTLFCGSKDIFGFVNPKRDSLDPIHLFRGTVLDRIVIGQRLGELMNSPTGQNLLTGPILKKLAHIIEAADCLPDNAKAAYIQDNCFRSNKLYFSKIREAPALGAGIDAQLTFTKHN